MAFLCTSSALSGCAEITDIDAHCDIAAVQAAAAASSDRPMQDIDTLPLSAVSEETAAIKNYHSDQSLSDEAAPLIDLDIPQMTDITGNHGQAAMLGEQKISAKKETAEESTSLPEPEPVILCPGYPEEYIASLTEDEQAEAAYFMEQGYVFYRQNWSVTKDLEYGDDGFGQCGCGPTCAAAIIANLAGEPVTPEDMRQWALAHNSYIPHVGTTYDLMISAPKEYGITTRNVGASDKAAVIQALKDGKLVLACMGPGDFTLGAHFMLYRGITEDGKILIADSYSYTYSTQAWDWDTLEKQLKNGYWIYEKENGK